jgi:beta-alanine degradation protein BauB
MDCRVKPGNDDRSGRMTRPAAEPVALLEDDVVRVTRWNFAPGGETKWHRHEMDYVIVPMTECRMLLEEAEGERRVDMAAGAVYRRDEGVEHNVVNAGDQPMSFIEIEIKPRLDRSRGRGTVNAG